MSSAPLPKSVRHVVPRRGYVVSCFVWTCRLAMIVEEILSLQAQGPPISTDPWDQQFAARQKTAKDQWQAAEELSQQLKLWRQSLPRHLDVNPTSRISPLPHHVVGLAVSEVEPAQAGVSRLTNFSRKPLRHGPSISLVPLTTVVVHHREHPAALPIHPAPAGFHSVGLSHHRAARHYQSRSCGMFRGRPGDCRPTAIPRPAQAAWTRQLGHHPHTQSRHAL
jgi:hypothetical protein